MSNHQPNMAYQQQLCTPIFRQMEVDQLDVGAFLGQTEQMGQSSSQENGNGFHAPVVGTHHSCYPNRAVQRENSLPVAPVLNQDPINSGTLQPPMMGDQMHGIMGFSHSPMMGNQMPANMGIAQYPMMGNQMPGNMGIYHSPMMGNQMYGNLGVSQAPMMGNGQGPFTRTSQHDFMPTNQAASADDDVPFPKEGILAEFADVDMGFRQRKQMHVMNNNHAAFMNNMQVASVGNVQAPPVNGMQMNGMGSIRTPAVNISHASQQKMSTLSPTAPAFIPNRINNRQQSVTSSMRNMRQQSAAPSMGEQMQIQSHQSSRCHTKKNKHSRKNMHPQKNVQPHQHEPLTNSTDRSLQIKGQAQFQQAQMLQYADQSQCSQNSVGIKAKQPDEKQAKKGSEPHLRAPGTQSTPVHTPETMRSTSIEAIIGMTNTSLTTEMSTEPHRNDLLESIVKNGKPKRVVPQQPTQQSAKRSSTDTFAGQDPESMEGNQTKHTAAAKRKISREQYVTNAKTTGVPIPPSRRRMVVLHPTDPRCIIKDGVTTAPAPDAYNGTTSHDPLSRLPKLTGSLVYTMGPPFTQNELNQMVSDLVGTNQIKISAPPSENVTSKKRRSGTRKVQTVARDAAAYRSSSTAQSVPDNSVTPQSASPDTIPGSTSDGGFNAQPSRLDGNLSQIDGPELQHSMHKAAGVNYYGDQPTVSTDQAEVASPPEPVEDANNSVKAVSTLPSHRIICPFTQVDLSPLMDLGSVVQQDVPPTAPAQQDTQLDIDPALTYRVAQDINNVSITDSKATQGQAIQSPTALPKTAGVDGCAPQEQANVSQQSLAAESCVPPQEQQTCKISNELDRSSGEQSMVSVPEAVSEEIIDNEHTTLDDLHESDAPLDSVPSGSTFADEPWFLDDTFPDNLSDEFGIADTGANSNDGISYANGEEEDNPFSQPSAIPGFNFARGITSPHSLRPQISFARALQDDPLESHFPRVATYQSQPEPQFEPYDPHSITLGGHLPD
ncbi:hypothetical protein FGRMN_1036 [Fusarium graminum]|nr:hypothetical protein FGRMN_1036 [Fusarium graminum]